MGLTALALLIYLALRASMPLAGTTLLGINQHLGTAPFPSLTGALWGILLRAGELLPLSTTTWATFLSALFGAANVGLVALLTGRWFLGRDKHKPTRSLRHGAITAVVISALYLTVSIPYWIAATGASPLPFQTFLLLLPFVVLWTPGEHPTLGKACLATFLYGLAVTEFSTAILIAPFFVILLLIQLALGGRFRFSALLALTGAGILGLTPYLLGAFRYYQHPVFEWREFDHFGQILWYLWHEQYRTLTATVPRHGWLTVFLVSWVPLILVTTMASPRALGEKARARIGTNLLMIVLTILGIGLLFNVPISPWNLTGLQPLLVTPYVIISMWVGLVFGYWWLALHRYRTASSSTPPRVFLVRGFTVAMVALLVVMGFRADREAGRDVSRLIRNYTEAVLRDAAPFTWLITESPLDDHLAFVAHEKDLPLRQIRASFAASPVAMRYIASLFEEPRFQSLARIGLPSLIEEWIRTDLDITGKLVTHQIPDVFASSDLDPIPVGLIYHGRFDPAVASVDDLSQHHERVIANLGLPLAEITGRPPHQQFFIDAMLQHLSRNANNLGVALEDREAHDLAFKAYADARMLLTNNISALINQHYLAGRIEHEEFPALDEQLQHLIASTDRGWQSWALARHYGFVRVPEAYVQRGMSWAMSGRPGQAITELQRAASLTRDHTGLQLALGGLYFAEERDEESLQTYQAVLARDPDNQVALFGLLRLAIRQEDFVGAVALLERLRELGASSLVLKLEESVLAAQKGDYPAALSLLESFLQERPDYMPAWGALLVNANLAQRPDIAARALVRLRQAETLPVSLRITLAQHALREGSWQEARQQIDTVLRTHPGSVPALDAALRLDLAEGKREQAQRHVELLLTQDPGHAFGNYILGTLQYHAEQYALAESSFRASLATQRSPEAMGDLAWLMARRGAMREALPLVREALELNPNNGAAWDTLGVILTRVGRLEDADQALQRALALRPDSAEINLHLAQLYERKGRHQEALNMAESLQNRASELSTSAFQDLRDLLGRLRAIRDAGA
ncbi:MAG TPA: tetratricopeptide repeat protein [Kiritimatiellia bacterium]|nr:tetratricopeptide repeat protein [Kiritimatiellia bacterium]